ncbi:MAG: hypothetical protein LBD02_01650 [Christensenellaceae bacterium]|jgi:hypothetical protein|nr:hypothetical protein [Christensenellaceae bacterium]
MDILSTYAMPDIGNFSAEPIEGEETYEAKTPRQEKEPAKKPRTRSTKTNAKQFYRRFTSERSMEEVLDWEFEAGSAYHVISGGDVDSLSFLKHVLR